MNPVTRYVKEVERHLSGPRRLQTSARIYKALSVKADALEKKLGREPTDAEMEALLAEFGQPAEVAASYAAREAPAHELVERYLAAVARGLPKEQAKDILLELREALTSKIEAREEASGKSASEDDIAAVLKDFGNPTLVASRYSGNDYLIGPSLFPWFWPAQRTVFGVASVIIIILAVIRALTSSEPMEAIMAGVFGVLEAGVFTFGVVTLVFIALQQTDTDIRIKRVWNPKTLPQDHIRKPRPLFDSVLALAFDAIFILWWVRVVDVPRWTGERDGLVDLHVSDAWAPVWTPILVLALIAAAVHLADIFRPGWSRVRSAVSIAGHAGGIAVIIVLLNSGRLLAGVFAEGGSSVEDPVGALDLMLRYALILTAAAWAIGLSVEAWRMMKSLRLSSSSPVAAQS